MMNRIWSAAFGKPRNVVALLLLAVAAILRGRAAADDVPDWSWPAAELIAALLGRLAFTVQA